MLSLGLREPHISLPGGVLPRFCQWKALRSPAEQEGDRTCFSPSVCSFCQISLGKSLSSPTPLVHLSGSPMHFWGQPQGCPWWPASALPLDSAPVRPSAVGSSERLKQHHRLGSAPSSEVRVRLLPAPLPSSRFLGPPSPLAPPPERRRLLPTVTLSAVRLCSLPAASLLHHVRVHQVL